jgi:hypothetical protein
VDQRAGLVHQLSSSHEKIALFRSLFRGRETMPRRALTAWLHGAQNELIAEANVADDCLFGAAIAKLRTAKGAEAV